MIDPTSAPTVPWSETDSTGQEMMMNQEIDKPSQRDSETSPNARWFTSGSISASERGRRSPRMNPDLSVYESLVGKLLTYRDNSGHNVILMASAAPGDGTSTVARNCAMALGQGLSERVVLIDANLRTPSQHTALDIARSDGLTDVLAGDVALRSAVISDLQSGFSLLASGRPTRRPQHLFTQSIFRDAIQTLQSEFDWVIIDSPPLTAYPDAACLAGAADGAVLVLRAESTRWEVAEAATHILNRSGIGLVCAVLNRRRYHIPEHIYHRL